MYIYIYIYTHIYICTLIFFDVKEREIFSFSPCDGRL